MISKSDMVRATTIKYYITDNAPCEYNKYFNKRIIPLEYFFRWRYEDGFTADMPFRVNLLLGAT